MAIVSINEAPQPETKPAEDVQETSVGKMVEEFFSRAKKARARWDTTWQPNYEFVFGGKQWTLDRPAWRFSEVVNVTWANIMTEVGIQTDASPRVEYDGTETSDFDFAKQLEKINEVNWTKYPWLQRLQDALLQCKWAHATHAEVSWNPDLEDGLGDVELKILDPFYCYPDPVAKDIEECRYFIYAEPVCTAKLKKEYPQFADQIQANVEMMGSTNDVVSTTSDRGKLGSMSNPRANRGTDRFGGEPMSLLVRCWMKDDAVEEYEETKKDGSKEYVQKLKYPKGRYVEMVGKLVLCDGPNGVKINGKIEPYEDGKFPIARLVNYSYGEYYGETEVTHAKGPQKILNYIWSHSLDQMKMASNPITVIGAASGMDPDNLANEPGQKWIANDINQVRREPGLGLAPGMEYLFNQAKTIHDVVYGLTDVMRGAVDSAVTSGFMLDGIVEAAQVRPRMKNRNLNQFIYRVGYLMASRYLQFYTAPRVFRITNEQGWPEFVEFYITGPEGNRVANVTKTVMDPELGPQIQPTQQMPVKGIPDIKVQSGTALPLAKALKSKTALEYKNAGVIDEEEVLKSVDWPNYQKVLERMQRAAQQQAQLQAQQGGKV